MSAANPERVGRGTGMSEVEDVLFDYVSHGNPKSDEHLRQYLRRYPRFREEIVEFTANWRVASILEAVLPSARPDPVVERKLLRRGQARCRRMQRRTGATRRA